MWGRLVISGCWEALWNAWDIGSVIVRYGEVWYGGMWGL